MTLNEILSIFNFYVGKFSGDTTEEQNFKIRAINLAKDIVISQLGLPSSEKTFRVNFLEEKEKYVLPGDFLEPISLIYDENISQRLNEQTYFDYLYPDEITKKGKYAGYVFWGIDYSDNSPRLIIKTKNTKQSSLIDECETLSLWSASNDATSLSIDSVRFVSGSGSLKFKIDETLSGNQRATITLTLPQNIDLSSYVGDASFYLQMFMQNPTGVSSITLSWRQNDTNYWYTSVSTTADGLSFQSNVWNELVFNWQDAVQIGNPNPANISKFQIDIDYNETIFSSPQFWNVDLIKISSLDKLILKYYSENVVKDGSTSQEKKDFSNTNDIALFATPDASVCNLVAQIAASLYKPLINKEVGQDASFLNALNSDILNTYKLRYPKRTPIYYRGKISGPKLRYN